LFIFKFGFSFSSVVFKFATNFFLQNFNFIKVWSFFSQFPKKLRYTAL
jgi:hypothetical protein